MMLSCVRTVKFVGARDARKCTMIFVNGDVCCICRSDRIKREGLVYDFARTRSRFTFYESANYCTRGECVARSSSVCVSACMHVRNVWRAWHEWATVVSRPSSFMRHFLHALNAHTRTQYTYEVQESMKSSDPCRFTLRGQFCINTGYAKACQSAAPMRTAVATWHATNRHRLPTLIMASCDTPRSRRADFPPVSPTQTNRWIFCHWCNIDDWMVVSLKSGITCWECQYCNVNAVENLCWKQHCICMVKIRECFHCWIQSNCQLRFLNSVLYCWKNSYIMNSRWTTYNEWYSGYNEMHRLDVGTGKIHP